MLRGNSHFGMCNLHERLRILDQLFTQIRRPTSHLEFHIGIEVILSSVRCSMQHVQHQESCDLTMDGWPVGLQILAFMIRQLRISLCFVLMAWWIGAVYSWAFSPVLNLGQSRRHLRLTLRRVRERRQPNPRQHQQKSTDLDGHTDPRHITPRVTQAASASEVLKVMHVEHDNPSMNLIAVSAAWTRLSKLHASITARVAALASLQSFVELTKALLERPSGFSRQVANMLWATAKLQDCIPMQDCLQQSLARAVKSTATGMNAQEVGIAIWAVGTCCTGCAHFEALLGVLPILAARLRTVMSEVNSQGLANVIWATGQLSVDPCHLAESQGLRDLLPSLVTIARRVLPTAKPQELANLCSGLALSGHYDAVFFEAVTDRVVDEAERWPPAGAQKDLPEVLCAFARLKAVDHSDLLSVYLTLSPVLAGINDWGLCALSWSYKELDFGNEFLEFRRRLAAEVSCRKLSEADVERSRLGPRAWELAARKPCKPHKPRLP
ncbi:unnamed protein product [Effrenium voratum]|nr:unnamed protein product [Effrenium voratum]